MQLGLARVVNFLFMGVEGELLVSQGEGFGGHNVEFTVTVKFEDKVGEMEQMVDFGGF